MSRKLKKYDAQQEMCERLKSLERLYNFLHWGYVGIEFLR